MELECQVPRCDFSCASLQPNLSLLSPPPPATCAVMTAVFFAAIHTATHGLHGAAAEVKAKLGPTMRANYVLWWAPRIREGPLPELARTGASWPCPYI